MSGTVRGTVKDSVTKALITNAVVTAPPYTVNNANGSYSFETNGTETIAVTASAPTYQPQTVNVNAVNGSTVFKNFQLSH